MNPERVKREPYVIKQVQGYAGIAVAAVVAGGRISCGAAKSLTKGYNLYNRSKYSMYMTI